MRSNKKRRTRGGKKGKDRRNEPDFDPLTADTTLDQKAASEAGNLNIESGQSTGGGSREKTSAAAGSES